jgi:heat-inducible transcriptional repressor
LLRQALDSHERQRAGEAEAMVAAGLGGLLAQPEFRSSSSLLPLVQLVEQRPRQLLGPSAAEVETATRLSEAIWIGREHPQPALEECAVVQASYRTLDGAQGEVALIGPMRMAYATAQAAVQSVATILQRLLS